MRRFGNHTDLETEHADSQAWRDSEKTRLDYESPHQDSKDARADSEARRASILEGGAQELLQ